MRKREGKRKKGEREGHKERENMDVKEKKGGNEGN